jgi:putative mRNA 3-end processing factor
VLATRETLAVMRTRMGAERAGGVQQAVPLREPVTHNGVIITLYPAGHVLGAAQIRLQHAGSTAIISGDYKRQPDPTTTPFEPMPCDVFVTEATFGLPVFRHPQALDEIGKLLTSLALFPERTHVVGAYALGKCQRVIATLRQAGFDAPIYLHGAHMAVCQTYRELGIDLGELRPATVADKAQLKGAIVLAPPSAIADRWARRLEDPVVAMASGWMRVRQRAKAGGIELPLIISDHADWDDLLTTIAETRAPEVWVTHGAEEALIHELSRRQIRARALSLIGYGEDEGEEA